MRNPRDALLGVRTVLLSPPLILRRRGDERRARCDRGLRSRLVTNAAVFPPKTVSTPARDADRSRRHPPGSSVGGCEQLARDVHELPYRRGGAGAVNLERGSDSVAVRA